MTRFEQQPSNRRPDEEPDFGEPGGEGFDDSAWAEAPMTDDKFFAEFNPREEQRILEESSGNSGLGDPKNLNRDIRSNGGQG